MTSTSIGYANTARTLESLSNKRATGELTLTSGDRYWKLYFFHGRLVYGTGNFHRIRRWQRAIKQYYPDCSLDQVPQIEPWEYQLLSQQIVQNHLSVPQAQAVIQASLEEVLFSWVSNLAMTADWSAIQRFSFRNNSALSLLLSSAQVERVLHRAKQLWKHWQSLELGTLSPYNSPILRQPPLEVPAVPALPERLAPFLAGNHTLWDIATHAQRPVTTVTRYLLPWVQRGVITLEDIPDLALCDSDRPTKVVEPATARPLIACIDDSPTVSQVLAHILEPAGYRVLTIQEPLSGIATLVKYKPDLIFLDLVMPDTSGYNLCSFLRRTPAFQNTPIIILTSQDSILERTRAKLVGASDFLAKPPDPQILLALVQSHLRSVMSVDP